MREGGGTGRWPRNPILAAAAAALVAVDAMTFADAQALIADYDPALTRGRDHRDPVSGETGQPVAPARPDIGQLRVVPCERVIDRPGGRLTIHYVAFACHATILRVTLRLDDPSGRRPSGHQIPGWARRLSVTGSRGMAAAAEFSGGGRIGDWVWHGQYEVRPQLAAETAWIELLGERVELTARPAGIQTWAEPLPAQDPAVRHLWERVATLNDFHDPTSRWMPRSRPSSPPGRLRRTPRSSTRPGQCSPCCVPAARTRQRLLRAWPSRGDRCWRAGGKLAGQSARSQSARSRRRSTG